MHELDFCVFFTTLVHPPGGGGAMEKKPRENAVYVTSLPMDVTEEKLAELFGSIGVIKVGVLGHFKLRFHFTGQFSYTLGLVGR